MRIVVCLVAFHSFLNMVKGHTPSFSIGLIILGISLAAVQDLIDLVNAFKKMVGMEK